MTKKVTFGARPGSKKAGSADYWVENRNAGESEPMKRLTIDIPESLHRLIKGSCGSRGTKMADEIRELLTQKYGNQ